MIVHWCGVGLSSIPGLRRLIIEGYDVIVWNRTLSKAVEAVGDITYKIRKLDKNVLFETLYENDIIVSMLPAEWHVQLASMAIVKKVHFVSSSYITSEMFSLDSQFKKENLVCINEVGLDPGIDHLMAHKLVANYRRSKNYNSKNDLSFLSYCGGIPKYENEFKYKFSWSPIGVLKALNSPSKSIRNYEEYHVSYPWKAISNFKIPLEKTENFEVYPNRDSLPFINSYKFEHNWIIKDFVRGTLRLNGWCEAWREVFKEIESLKEEKSNDIRLQRMSDKFWKKYAYKDNEPDRVVLFVTLKASKKNTLKWQNSFVLDAWGNNEGSAMSRLVSQPVSFAVEAIIKKKLNAGVQAAPSNIKIVNQWLFKIENFVQYFKFIEHN